MCSDAAYPLSYDENMILPVDAQKSKLSLLVIFFLVPFVVAAISVAGLEVWNYIVIVLGVVCGCAYLISLIHTGLHLPREILFLVFFTFWSLVSLLFCQHPAHALLMIQTQTLIIFMVVIIAQYSDTVKNVMTLLFAVLIGIAIIAISSYVTGEYQRAEYSDERAAGLALNSNSFAIALNYAMAILLYFFRIWRSLLVKGGILALLLILIQLIIASGSRKGFLGVFFLLFVWFFFSYRREIFKKPIVTLLTLGVVVSLALFSYIQIRGTFLEHRLGGLEELSHASASSGSIGARQVMILEGLTFVKSNPILGLGPNHFVAHSSTGKYSHNNYIEVFSNTGLPGGCMYYAIFFILGFRLFRLGKQSLNLKDKEFINICKTVILYHLAISLTAVNYYGKLEWIVLAIIIGYSYHLDRQIRIQSIHQASFFPKKD